MSNSPSPELTEYFHNKAELWRVYVQAYSGINTFIDKALRKHANIKLDDFQVLTVLIDGGVHTDPPRQVRMGQIATALNLSPSRLTYHIERLIEKGWVERAAVEEDRRGKGVFITEAGYERYMEGFKVHSNLINNVITADISAKEIETMTEAMKKMLDSINP